MDLIKESKSIPQLVDPKNFKIKKVISSFKENTKNLNTFLLVGFVIFFTFFLLNCKYGIFKSDSFEPEPYVLNGN